MSENARRVAEILLKTQAVKLNLENPFQWSSGWHSPIYCDNRVTLSYPEDRRFIRDSLSELIKDNFGDAQHIAGVATAGIPQGALVADQLNKPFLYVRSKPKGHGMQNMIEGKAVEGETAVLVEDLISTGGSSLKAADALVEAGMKVNGLVAIFTYGFDHAVQNFADKGVPFLTLSNYDTLVEVALEMEYIKADQLDLLRSWRTDPENWGK